MQDLGILDQIDKIDGVKFDRYMSTIELFKMNGIYYVKKRVQPPAIGSKRLVFLAFLTRIMCTFEVKALRALHGLKGVVQIVRQDSPTSFISLYEDATPICMTNNLTSEYFDKLGDLFQSIHKRGVVDLDLIHESDKLIDPDGNPVLLDFGVAITCSAPLNGLRKIVFEFLCRQHELHRIELKNKYFPQKITAEERMQLEKAHSLLKIERRIHRLRVLPKRLLGRVVCRMKATFQKKAHFF